MPGVEAHVKMSRTFAIANHPQRQEIEADILQGGPCTDIAKKYGISSSAVDRYKKKALRQQLQIAAIKDVDSLIDRLNEYLDGVDQMYDSIYDWLSDPDDPARLTIEPRSREVSVITETETGDKTVRRKEKLSDILDEIRDSGRRVLEVAVSWTDPRQLLLSTVNTLQKTLEIIAKAKGDIVDTKVEVRAVTGNTADIISKITKALEPFPGAIEAVADALEPYVLPLEGEDG